MCGVFSHPTVVVGNRSARKPISMWFRLAFSDGQEPPAFQAEKPGHIDGALKGTGRTISADWPAPLLYVEEHMDPHRSAKAVG